MISFGMGQDVFKEKYFEKNFFLKRGAIKESFFDFSSLEEILDITSPASNKFRFFKDGFVDEKYYTKIINDIGSRRPVVVKEKFYDLVNSGATLVLSRVDLTSLNIRKLCALVSNFTGFPATANGYFATTGQGTFGNHWDTHDVFAIQLFGKKRWKIYEPTFLLPVSSQTSLHKKTECPKTPIFDEYLSEGDCLYIPRGFWHNAAPTAGETFHVAIGVHTVKVWDYLKWAVAEVLPDVYQCRKTIEVFSEMNLSTSSDLAMATQALSSAVLDEKLFQEYLTACANSIFNNDFFELEKNCINRSSCAHELDNQEASY